MTKKILFVLGFLAEAVRSQTLPSFFHTTYQFEIEKEGSKSSVEILREYLPLGEQTPAVLSLGKGEKLFLMNRPSVDRCGVIHFSGREVKLESHRDFSGEDLRFYEKPSALDIFCVPVPFPRCGTFRSEEYQTVGLYLEEQMKLYGAQCEVFFQKGSTEPETYRIRTVSNLGQ